MNKLGKSGAILIIIGSAFMLIFAIVAMFTGGFLITEIKNIDPISGIATNIVTTIILIIGVIACSFSIVNIVLASLTLAGRQDLIIATGVLGLVSLFFGATSYIIPAVLLLVGAILLFCSKKSSSKTREAVIEIKAVPTATEA